MRKDMKFLALFFTLIGTFIASTSAQQVIRVTCVGDSITEGSGLSPESSYPSQLQTILGKDWLIQNCGISGRTLLEKGDFPYRQDPAYQRALESKPHFVIIMLGTNDTKPHNWKFQQEFYPNYLSLVESFEKLSPQPTIFICRPCPIPGEGNFGINNANLQQAITEINRLASAKKLDIIDMHAALKDYPTLIPDRVHPNADGAKKMAEAAAKILLEKKSDLRR
jgi:lysophospholipase L1-like esterase